MSKQRFYLLLFAAGHMCTDLCPGALPALLPFFVLHYQMSYTEVAGLVFASSAMSSVIQPVFGLFADKADKHWFMPLGVALSAGGFAVAGFLENYWAIFLAINVMGVGCALFHPEAAKLVNKVAGDKRGMGMGIFSVGGNAGFGFGPLILVAVVSAFGLKGTAVFGLAAVAMVALFAATLPGIVAYVKEREAPGAAAAGACHCPACEAASARGAAAAPSAAPSAAPAELPPNDWRGFARLTLVICGRSTLFASFSAFLPLLCIASFSVSEGAAGTVLSAFSIMGVGMTLIGGWLADRIGLVKALRTSWLFLAPGFLLVLYAPSFWTVYPIIALLSFGLNGCYAAFVVLGQTYLGRNIGLASGVTLGISCSVGGMMLPLLGKLADAQGLPAVFWVLVAVAAAGTVLTFLLPEPASARAPGR
ncbi:MAG: MFS transporter [Duodenibacillus sp.]|nr:MFS transporter [Duodenibacillus sp.]